MQHIRRPTVGDAWRFTGCLCVVFAWNLCFRSTLFRIPLLSPAALSVEPIRHGFFISLVDEYIDTVAAIERGGIVPNVTVVRAVNASLDFIDESMPLYTRYVLSRGRSDHMQLGSRAAAGCLLSHGRVWRRIIALNTTAIVFEEDVVVAKDSASLLRGVLKSVENVSWGILMLDPGHVNVNGEWNAVTPVVSNCSTTCEWFGTRVYAIRPHVAKILLDHMEPVIVQVDALITLVATYHPSVVRMHWTNVRIFPPFMLRRSTVNDWCIKCFLPNSPGPYFAFIAIAIVILTIFVIVCWVTWLSGRAKSRRASIIIKPSST
jgi:hypothetical protein